MSKSIYLFSTSSHPDATHINSLEIQFFKPTINFSDYDYLLITSKQIVKGLMQYDKADYIDKKALCISKQTAQSYKDIGGTVLETAKGYGDSLSEYIAQYPASTKWLYLRAKVVASDFAQSCREKGYNIDELVLYESRCSTDILEVEIERGSTLIFTSPSSVECYLKKHQFHKEDTIIVIGTTTAKKIPKHIQYSIAKEPTIESCLEFQG